MLCKTELELENDTVTYHDCVSYTRPGLHILLTDGERLWICSASVSQHETLVTV